MPYLIDGHNLIPKVAGLSLKAIDDEMQLIELLQEFCRIRSKQVEVFFDNSPPGQPGSGSFGPVTARFVREGRTADDAIAARLKRLGRSARNWTVVSSDRAVQAAAREAQAQVLSSEAFSGQLKEMVKESDTDMNERTKPSLSPDEIDDWLDLFRKGRDGG
jgi:predicted RNA-binding protein with PIN domain